MKTIMRFTLLSFALMGLSSVAQAAGVKVGADATVHVPMGDFADGAGPGFGALGRGEFALDDSLSFTGRLGYIYHLEKNSVSFSQLPVMAGVKYHLSALYLAAELGFVRSTVSINATVFGTNISSSASDTNPAASLGAGVELGDLDLRGGLHFLDLGHVGDTMTLGLSAGYSFVSL